MKVPEIFSAAGKAAVKTAKQLQALGPVKLLPVAALIGGCSFYTTPDGGMGWNIGNPNGPNYLSAPQAPVAPYYGSYGVDCGCQPGGRVIILSPGN